MFDLSRILSFMLYERCASKTWRKKDRENVRERRRKIWLGDWFHDKAKEECQQLSNQDKKNQLKLTNSFFFQVSRQKLWFLGKQIFIATILVLNWKRLHDMETQD